MRYRPEIDGLRALAVIPVILYHAGFNLFSGGFVGVDVFFVISGYLISSIILSELNAGTFSLVNFYERRARRILPALFLVLFVCLPFAWAFLLPDAMKQFSESLIAVSTFTSNILFYKTSGYFDIATELKPLIHTWSLAVEEQYYVLFPLFLLLSWKFQKRWTAGLLISIFLISLSMSQWLSTAHPKFNFYMLPTRGWELLIGIFIAMYFKNQPIKNYKHINQWASLLGILLITYSIFAYNDQTPFPSLYALIPTAGAALIIIFATDTTIVNKLLSSKPFIGVGLISYSAYLWHQPIFAFAREWNLNELNTQLMAALSVLSFALAFLSWKYVEMPFRKKDFISRNKLFLYGLILSLFFIGFGAAGILNKGFMNRFDGKIKHIIETTKDGALPACKTGLKTRESGALCIIGNKNITPSIALIGDSHSSKLTSALNEELIKVNISAVVFAESFCPPLIDMATDNINKNPMCRVYINNAYDEIISNKNIKTVILHAEWANYTKGMRAGDKTISYYTDHESIIKDSSENIAVFSRALHRTKESLQKAKKKIVIIKSVPEYNFIVWKKIAKSIQLQNHAYIANEVKVNLYKYSDRNLEVENTFNAIHIEKWAEIIDPYKIFCKEEYCEYTNDNLDSFYSDDNHLTLLAAKKIVGPILNIINTPTLN